jgi:hypothetical protein
VTETAGPALDPVTETAGPALDPVTETAGPALDPVTETAGPALDPVTETAGPALDPVTETLDPVTETAGPALDPVTETATPVVDVPGSDLQAGRAVLDAQREPHAHGGTPTRAGRGVPFGSSFFSPFGTAPLFGPASGPAGPSPEGAFVGAGGAASPIGASPDTPPQLPAPSGGSGSIGSSGFGSSTLFAILVALAAFSAQRFSRQLRLALAPWRPSAFIAVIERPG